MPFSTIKEYKARGLVEVSLTNKISGPYPHLLKLGNYPSCSGRKLKDYYVGNWHEAVPDLGLPGRMEEGYTENKETKCKSTY